MGWLETGNSFLPLLVNVVKKTEQNEKLVRIFRIFELISKKKFFNGIACIMYPIGIKMLSTFILRTLRSSDFTKQEDFSSSV